MRIDWMEDMLAIIEAGSMNEAADARFLTQPAFSRRVKALETLLGFDIIDRSRRPARPTDAMLEHETQIRDLAAKLRALILDLNQESRRGANRIVIASQHAITTSLAPAIVTALAGRGRSRIRLRSANRSECYTQLFTRQVDLIFIYQLADEKPEAGAEFTEDKPIGSDRLIPVYDAAAVRSFDWTRDAGEIPVIIYPSDVFLGELFNTRILPKIGPRFTIWPIAETALTVAALQLSKAATGIAWVPASLAEADIRSGQLADLSDRLPDIAMDLIVRRLPGPKSALEDHVWSMAVSDDSQDAAQD